MVSLLRWLVFVPVLSLVGPLAHSQVPTPAAPPYPALGSDLPGPFQPYNVNGKRAKKFHCLVSEFGLNPVAMVVLRSPDATPPVTYLLTKLDNMVDKNPATRMAAFAVIVSDDFKSVAREDDAREPLELNALDLVKTLAPSEASEPKHVVIALDSTKDLEKYKLDPQAAMTVVLYNQYRTVAVFSFKKEEITEDNMKKVLATAAEKFNARR